MKISDFVKIPTNKRDQHVLICTPICAYWLRDECLRNIRIHYSDVQYTESNVLLLTVLSFCSIRS